MNLAEVVEKYRRHRLVPLLLGIFLLGFAIRYLARGPRIGPELDTWFHFRMVNYILDLGYVPEIDPLAYYPTGRPVWKLDLLGLPFFIAYTYKIVGITGITLMDYMVAFPAIFTSLAAIPLYLLTKELLNRKAGLLAALFWQIIPSTLTRTHAGFVDKETLASVYIFLWLWLFIKSIKSVEMRDQKTLLTPILSGIFMGLSAWTWGGAEYFILVMSTSVFLHTVLTLNNLNESLGYSIILMTLFGAMTLFIVQAPRFPLQLLYNNQIYTSLSLLSLILGLLILYSHLKVQKGEKYSKYVIGTIILIFLSGALISGKLQSFFNQIIMFANRKVFLNKSLVGATVSENLSPSFFCGEGSIIAQIMRCDWYSHFNIVLFIAPLGAVLLLNRYREKKDFKSLFLLVYAISGVLGMRSDIRLSFVLTPVFAMLSAYFIIHFISSFQTKERELQDTLARSKKHKVRYKAETQLSNTKITRIVVVIILIGIIASPTVASFFMLNGRAVDVPQPWYKAMIWINDNTPEDAVIVSWWDYGYWEQALGNRRTVVDGGNAGPLVFNTEYTEGLEYRGSTVHRDVDMAKMFTSTEDVALKYLRPYVDYEKVPTYVIVSYEEFGKSGAINHISQGGGLYIFPQRFEKSGDSEADSKTIMDFIVNNGIESYTVLDFGDSWQMWFTGFDPNKGPDPGMKNKLLPKLLPLQNTGFGQGLERFEPVYADDWNYVFIYKVV
jgi:dolichyl-diphosphooligosaccharide--protein glycosyltransferase